MIALRTRESQEFVSSGAYWQSADDVVGLWIGIGNQSLGSGTSCRLIRSHATRTHVDTPAETPYHEQSSSRPAARESRRY